MDNLFKTILENSSTMALRQLLHNPQTARAYKCHTYAILLQRKHASRKKRHGG